mgnify:CR=1 FL=1
MRSALFWYALLYFALLDSALVCFAMVCHVLPCDALLVLCAALLLLGCYLLCGGMKLKLELKLAGNHGWPWRPCYEHVVSFACPYTGSLVMNMLAKVAIQE